MGMPSLSILIKIMDGCMGTRLHGNKATTKTAEGEGGQAKSWGYTIIILTHAVPLAGLYTD